MPLTPEQQSALTEAHSRGLLNPKQIGAANELLRRQGGKGLETVRVAPQKDAQGVVQMTTDPERVPVPETTTVGQFGTGLNEGMANIAGAPVDLMNAGLSLLGIDTEKPFLGSKSIKEDILQPLGVMEGPAQTTGDRFLRKSGQVTGETLGTLVPLLKAGQSALAAKQVISQNPQGLKRVADGLTNIVMQMARLDPGKLAAVEMAYGASAGLGGQAAVEAFPEHPEVADTLGQLTTSLGLQSTVGLLRVAGKMGRHKLIGLNEEEMRQEIGKMMSERLGENFADSEEELASRLAEVDQLKELFPGFEPTIGETMGQTGGISQQEKTFADKNPLFAQRRRAKLVQSQQALREGVDQQIPGKPEDIQAFRDEAKQIVTARNDAMDQLDQQAIDAVERSKEAVSTETRRVLDATDARITGMQGRIAERLQGYPEGATQAQRGEIIREEYLKELNDFRQKAKGLYDQVDLHNEMVVPADETLGAVDRLLADKSRFEDLPDDWIRRIKPKSADGAEAQDIGESIPDQPAAVQRDALHPRGNARVYAQALKAQADIESGRLSDRTPLSAFLLKRGGLLNQGGELSHMGASKLIKKKGMTLDRAAEVAKEEGLIPERNINMLLDTLNNEVRGLTGALPPWAQHLNDTGKMPLPRVKLALSKLMAHGITATGSDVSRMRQALAADTEFPGSAFAPKNEQEWAELADSLATQTVKPLPRTQPKIDTQEEVDFKFKDLRALRKGLASDIRQATTSGQDQRAHFLGEILDGVEADLRAITNNTELAAQYPEAVDQYRKASKFYEAGYQRLKASQAGTMRLHAGRHYNQTGESIAKAFLAGETPFEDFIAAVGHRPTALNAMRDAAKANFMQAAVDLDGRVVPSRAFGWVKRMNDQVGLFRAFPELRDEMSNMSRLQVEVNQLRKMAEKFERNPALWGMKLGPEGQSLNEGLIPQLSADQQRMAEIHAMTKRSRRELDNSAVMAFIGDDANMAAAKVWGSQNPVEKTKEIMGMLKDPAAVRGFQTAMWDEMVRRFESTAIGAFDKPALQANKMQQFLDRNADAMRAMGYGDTRIGRMYAALKGNQILAEAGKPVVKGDSATAARLQSIMMDWGPFLSRLYAGPMGRALVSWQWIVGERVMRSLASHFRILNNEQVEGLLMEAFFDPKVARDLMLAATSPNLNKLVQKRFMIHLANLGLADTEDTQAIKERNQDIKARTLSATEQALSFTHPQGRTGPQLPSLAGAR